ncbi:MAG: gamma-glutamyltransferase [Gammaproteobacteria bacterium]|nr:MAG: gamma-glutamyltransferase [Gammaproteobacteria bacterium]
MFTESLKRRRLLTGAFLLSLILVFLLAGCTGRTQGQAAIASSHPLATAAGMEILAAGGNAFDAAVAVSAALAVVEPYGSGLGGGGFWLLHRAADAFETMVDGRERAPLAATRDMYLDAGGEVVSGLSINGPLAAAIPGEPAALVHIAERYGRLPLKRTLEPAIRLARHGFEVDPYYNRLVNFRLAAMQADTETARLFLQDNATPTVGHRIVQPELAATLEALAVHGRDGFYAGRVAEQLVDGVRRGGGIWTLEDLTQYAVVEREPVTGTYQGLRMVSAAPPSSGGVVLVTMLNILSGFPLQDLDEATRTHVIIEAMRRAYRDRAEFLGDPDFTDLPVARLTGTAHAAGLRESIQPERATPSGALPDMKLPAEGRDTTHFSILDSEGNRVAATLSINYPFGACFTPPGTGVLLNDEMDDFSAKPGVPNVYGLVGAEANSIAPGKRPLSSMSPTFVENRDGVAILGTPGGSRIITMVLLAVLDHAEGGTPQSLVSLPRFHHQYLPDMVQYEVGAFDDDLVGALQARGHVLKVLDAPYGNMQAIYHDRKTGRASAASDPRGIGLSEVRPVN